MMNKKAQKTPNSQGENRVELVQTKKASVFNVELDLDFQRRHIGTLDTTGQGTFFCRRTEKHVHRKTNSLGINLEVCERFDFRWLVIDFCGESLVTTKNFLLHHSRVFTFDRAGFEKQRFMPLQHWGKEKAEEFEIGIRSQGELFPGVAA